MKSVTHYILDFLIIDTPVLSVIFPSSCICMV